MLIPPPTALAGRPDVRDVLQGWVDVDGGGGGGEERGRRSTMTGVVVSGPDGLVRDVRNVCAGLIWSGEDVSVQVEKFGW